LNRVSIVLTLLVISAFTLAFTIQPAKASGIIYIKADGSIDPPTALISTVDNITYTFTGNISDVSIVVQRDNIAIDGRDYVLEGTGTGAGMNLTLRSNVLIKNVEIKAFEYGIYLSNSSNNRIYGNRLVNNTNTGIYIYLHSDCNTISGNNITTNRFYGVQLFNNNDHNNICRNNITTNMSNGIYLKKGNSDNQIFRNYIAYDGGGIYFDESSSNSVHHNNFVNETTHVTVFNSMNTLDDGYPSGGNYWSGYTVVDLYSGPYQNETGSDGIGDVPYIINSNNKDNYPLMNPYIFPHDIAISNITFSKIVICQSYNANVNIIVENHGDYNETFNVTLNRLGTIIPASLVADHTAGWNGTMPGPTITVGLGDIVRLSLIGSNPIVTHDFFVDYDGNGNPSPGEPKSPDFRDTAILFEFVANTTGTFTYYCHYNNSTEYGTFIVNPMPTTTQTGVIQVSLPVEPDEVRVLSFIWNTTSVEKLNYTISAVADTVPDETDTDDNTFTDGWILISMVGDLTGKTTNPWDFVPDEKVDGSDLIVVSRCFGSSPTTPPPMIWNPNCDITNDNVVDGSDLIIVSKHFGEPHA
jgi:parallel beta-helix repeat protein